MLASHSRQMHGQKVSLEFERAVTALDIGTNPDMRHMRPCPQARNLCSRVAPADADSARFRYCFQLPTTTRLVTCVVWHTTQKESICNKILRGAAAAAALPGRRVKPLVSMFSQSRHQITTPIRKAPSIRDYGFRTAFAAQDHELLQSRGWHLILHVARCGNVLRLRAGTSPQGAAPFASRVSTLCSETRGTVSGLGS